MRLRLTWLLLSAIFLTTWGVASAAPSAPLDSRQAQATPPIPDAEKTQLAQGSPTPTATQASPPSATIPTPAPIDDDRVKSERLIFLAQDGVKLVGTLYLPVSQDKEQDKSQVYPGVIVLPMHVEMRQAWEWLALRLVEEKFAVLVMDLRGQGESRGAQDWQKAISDVLLVWNNLGVRPDVDEKRIAIVGASLGANLALNAAAAEPSIPTVVLLSPGINYDGVTSNQALEEIGNRRLLVIASQDDALAGDWPARMKELAPSKVELKLVPGSAHGSQLFETPPSLERTIIQWLHGKHTISIASPVQRYGRIVLVFSILVCIIGFAVILMVALLLIRWLRKH